MRFAVFARPLTVIYEKPDFTKKLEKGIVSAISDEGLYGTACQVIDRQDGWAHILTFYGYAGYAREESLLFMTEETLRAYLGRSLAVVEAGCADVLSLPAVQGVCRLSLPGGALLETLGEEETGVWTKVRLLEGGEGYVRTQHLGEKRFGEAFLWKEAEAVLSGLERISARSREAQGGEEGFSLEEVLARFYEGSEERFREQLTAEASRYLGVQYRWGGRSFQGIDCSGLVSMAYMKSGILIYRDASIADGFPIRRIGREDALKERLKRGDLLFFPGHVAMYIGEGRYIHSTARAGSGGVVVNSLREGEADYRADLRESLYAAGGVR